VPLDPVDITDADAVDRSLGRLAETAPDRPKLLFHLAALTDTRSDDPAPFEAVNVRGTRNVLAAAHKAGFRLVHISTDYVFAADTARAPFGEEDRPRNEPPGAYAASKYRAENWVLAHGAPSWSTVVRIAFPYGGAGNRPGLAEKLIGLFETSRRDGKGARLFDDQTICPSYIPDVVRGLSSLAAAADWNHPVLHLVGEPTTPWEFGGLVRRLFGFEDVPLEASSVGGTGYAGRLDLTSARTRTALRWRPTAHAEALREMRDRMKP
jgi:dTDP-4-dehydrorhamnose reductase